MARQSTHVLLPKQFKFIHSDAKHTLFVGGVGCGKTLAAAYLANHLRVQYPGSIGQISLYTYPAIRDVMIPKIREIFNMYSTRDFTYTTSGASGHKVQWSNRSEWWFRHLENEESIRGRDLDYVIIDEATVGVTRDAYNQLIARLRRGDCNRAYILTNPGSKAHWIYQLFYENRRESMNVIEMKTSENRFLPKGYETELRSIYSPQWQARMLDGKWGSMDNAVYREFSPAVHVREFQVGPDWEIYRGVDFGYDNAFVCLWVGLSPEGVFHVFHEHYRNNMLLSQHADAIRGVDVANGYPRAAITYADPSHKQTFMEFRTHLGEPLVGAKNAVEYGLEIVRGLLHPRPDSGPRLIVHPRCVNTIREFQGYEIQHVREGRPATERPEKREDHAMDALRYVLATVAPRRRQ